MKALIEEDDGPRKYDAASISVINRELYSGFLASCDFANYKEWMSQYRDDLITVACTPHLIYILRLICHQPNVN